MPGIVAFRRRWSVGSDDLVVPALFLVIVHTLWILILVFICGLVEFDESLHCAVDLKNYILCYIVILVVCVVLETAIACLGLRGTILNPAPRKYIEYFLYLRLVVGFFELAWLTNGVVRYVRHYQSCHTETAKQALLGIMICNWIMMLLCIISVWCSYDTAGAKWIKMKKYQDRLTDRHRTNNRKQSGSRRNWRKRKAIQAYEESWNRRLQLMCCCVEIKGKNKNSLTEIAQLFTEFFRDLDVVPSDIVAGLVLLRHHQKIRMKAIIAEATNDVYHYFSGVPITPSTNFLKLSEPVVMVEFIKVIHYMRYALAAYGWPVFVMTNPGTWLCRLLPFVSCTFCREDSEEQISDDNCCGCNRASLKHISGLEDIDIIYTTYHVDIGETPFFVALDHEFANVVVSVRGTLSLQDVLTDLKAEPETLPLYPPREDWQAHKGMVQAALYIKKKLIDDKILYMAWKKETTSGYNLVCVGHSLGAGIAAILAILLRCHFPSLHCYAFSPPGGLLSLPCVEETKQFITSVVVGKDIVPRIGLPQFEMLRTDIINLIKTSNEPKWNIISKSIFCCTNAGNLNIGNFDLERDATAHPSNKAIGLSAHTSLFPPGNIIHIVRSHVERTRGYKTEEAIYQALWGSNTDFDEVLVSPTMINDHMPDNVLDALEKVLHRCGPQKPLRATKSGRQMFPAHTPVCFFEDAQNVNKTSVIPYDLGIRNYITQELEKFSPDFAFDESKSIWYRRQQLASNSGQAPLASPETLSLASGIAVGGSIVICFPE